MMAAATLVALPTLVLFFLFQRVFIRSVVLTGMKG
jgi:ABC-type glycerol-3-phosphate transport system permease component